MNRQSFKQALEKHSLYISEKQASQFEMYRSFLQDENQKINLTALISDEDIYEKHFYDCALIMPLIQETARTFGDVGSGAGFPGVVVAILRPDLHVTLIEPTQKRCRFLEALIEKCELTNVTVFNQRAEESSNLFNHFDIVSARAVANMSILLELCIPLVKTGGHMIAMKGPQGLDELKACETALKKLHSTPIKYDEITLSDDSKRINILIHKEKTTPTKYPRPYPQIKKNPL